MGAELNGSYKQIKLHLANAHCSHFSFISKEIAWVSGFEVCRELLANNLLEIRNLMALDKDSKILYDKRQIIEMVEKIEKQTRTYGEQIVFEKTTT